MDIKNYAIIAFTFFIIQTSCSPMKQQLKRDENLCKLSNQVIANEVSRFKVNAKSEGRTLLVYIDTSLEYRPVLRPKFTYRERYELLFDAYPASHCVLQIPDSLSAVCKPWIKGSDAALGDSVEVVFYSSLLPTRQKRVFALQSYNYFSDSEVRIGYMNMYLFQVDRKKIISLQPLDKGVNAAAWSRRDYPIK